MGGSAEVFNLKWNQFHTTLGVALGGFLDDADFIDVTLACDGQTFSAHKVVLSACSHYFRDLLKKNPCKHPIIILKDVNASVLNSLLCFIYHGAVDVPKDDIPELVKTAQALKIKGLTEEGLLACTLPNFNSTNHLDNNDSTVSGTESPEFQEDVPDKSHCAASGEDSFGANVSPDGKDNYSLSDAKQENMEDHDAMPQESLLLKRLRAGNISVLRQTHQETNDARSEECVKQEMDDEIQIMETEDYTIQPYVEESEAFIKTLESQSMIAEKWRSTPRPKVRHYCQFCGKGFPTPIKLRSHVEALHVVKPIDEWDECNFCGKKFKTANYLATHLIVTHGIKKSSKSSAASTSAL